MITDEKKGSKMITNKEFFPRKKQVKIFLMATNEIQRAPPNKNELNEHKTKKCKKMKKNGAK